MKESIVMKYSTLKKPDHPIGVIYSGSDPKITFRILRRCNFLCPACSTFSDDRRKGVMSFADFKRAIDILAREKFCGVVNLSGGEPTLHPDHSDFIAYASGRLPGARIVSFTNGQWVGLPHWRQRLKRLLANRNVVVRFSHDRQHSEGAAFALRRSAGKRYVDEIEKSRFNKALMFLNACLEEGAEPGKNFDFAFKGSEEEARKYMHELGEVPLYLIKFQKDPVHRPKKWGYFALDVNEDNAILLYPTLGHIPAGESLPGMEHLPKVLKMNRDALSTKGFV
jgi:uncharacterized Fe-S cluster-containing radical SAM superfamily protein